MPIAPSFSRPHPSEDERPEVLSWCLQLAQLEGRGAVHVVQNELTPLDRCRRQEICGQTK